MITLRALAQGDVDAFRSMLATFGRVFEQPDVYAAAQPSDEYINRLLASDHFIALVALDGGDTVGALTAYELPKFEQERSELYIYDLAVDLARRRRGVATKLIREVQRIAKARSAHVIFVQADHGDEPAIALYTKLGVREDVLHFDIAPG